MDVLLELDRGLRSIDQFRQVETIHAIPDILKRARKEQHFALLLKIAEHFRTSGNEVRANIVLALGKAVFDFACASDEIVKRLVMVWESNDVYARAHVLVAFKSLAPLVASSVEAQYRVMQSLTSDYEVEYEAAAEAAYILAVETKGKFVELSFDSIFYRLKSPLVDEWLHDLLMKTLVEGCRLPNISPLLYTFAEQLDAAKASSFLEAMKTNSLALNVN